MSRRFPPLLSPLPAGRRRPRSRVRATALAAVLVAAIGAGCSARQAYDSAQGWQRNACQRVVDAIERERCVASATTSYDDYRRQRDGPGEAPGNPR
jgi:hypothetical protein